MFNKIIDNFKSKEVEIKPQMYVGKLKKTFEETFGESSLQGCDGEKRNFGNRGPCLELWVAL